MKLYSIKLENGEYQSNSSLQATKDKYSSLMDRDMLDYYIFLIDRCAFSIEQVNVERIRKVELSRMGFGVDGYTFETVPGVVIRETKKYVWCVEVANGNMLLATTKKYKKSDESTRSFKTAAGYRELR